MTNNGNSENNWMVFQTDVLDVLRQYEGYIDHSERVGSLEDDSRPDFVGRITRNDKKEVWVVDAKNKETIDEEDKERMNRYLEMLKSNPIDLGLELSEASEHEFKGVFITRSGTREQLNEYRSVPFKSLHQFLQKELVYTDTEKVVRDVAKMLERKQLSQSQARLLSRSLKPFENARERALNMIEKLETDYTDLKLKEAPFDRPLPVEAKLSHNYRDKIFLIDIPYSREALEKVPEKVEEAKKLFDKYDGEVFFAAIDTFNSGEELEHVYSPESFRKEIKKEASVMSPEEVAELFTPKVSTEKKYHDGFIEIRDTEKLGFRVLVKTENDVEYSVEASLNPKLLESINERMINSRKNFGSIKNNKFYLEFEILENGEIKYGDTTENMRNFRDTIKTIYQASVSPSLSRKVKASSE